MRSSEDSQVRRLLSGLDDEPVDAIIAEQPVLRSGEHLDRYELLGSLGRGGMGEVWEAQDHQLKRRVAIKLLRNYLPQGVPGVNSQPALDEARAIAQLSHDRFVRIHDIGTCPRTGQTFLVMERLEGCTLRRYIKQPRALSTIWRILDKILEGMSYAHARGILHCDLKPENVFITLNGDVKLLDLGLACLNPAGQETSVLHADLPKAVPKRAGTLTYMAPEIWVGGRPTARVDVWAIGVMLYECLTGRHPFWLFTGSDDENRQRICGPRVQPDFSQLRAVLPDATRAAVAQSLAKEPKERYADAGQMRTALGFAQFLPPVRWNTIQVPLDLIGSLRPWYRVSALARLAAPTRYTIRLLGIASSLAILSTQGSFHSQSTPDSRLPPGMVLLSGGRFRMGWDGEEAAAVQHYCEQLSSACASDQLQRAHPARMVELTPFFLDSHEVTNEKYSVFLNRARNLLRFEKRSAQGQDIWQIFGEHGELWIKLVPAASGIEVVSEDMPLRVRPGQQHQPVVSVTWDGAMAYCAALGQTLPSEAQWEYAARGSQMRRFPWGAGEPDCNLVAFGRGDGGPCAGRPAKPVDVGTSVQDQTPEGIYDLGGNVAEWVYDVFQYPYLACPSPCQDPVLALPLRPGQPDVRVTRGGSFWEDAVVMVNGWRGKWSRQGSPRLNFGFRCAAPVAATER